MQPSTPISHSFTLADTLIGTPQSARETIVKAIDGDKALRITRLAYEVLEGLQFGLGGVKILIEKWLSHAKSNQFDYRRGDGVVFKLSDPGFLWDAWEALDGSVGQRFMFLDAAGNATKIHVSLPEAGWKWWQGKKAWEIRSGQFVARDFIVTHTGEMQPFDGLRPRHLRPAPVEVETMPELAGADAAASGTTLEAPVVVAAPKVEAPAPAAKAKAKKPAKAKK